MNSCLFELALRWKTERRMSSVLIQATKLLSGTKDLFLCLCCCLCKTFPLKSFNENLVAQCFRHFVALNSVAKSFLSFSSSGYVCVLRGHIWWQSLLFQWFVEDLITCDPFVMQGLEKSITNTIWDLQKIPL